MANSRRGRKLTEDHRLAQVALKAQFLNEFADLWKLLNLADLNDSGPIWIATVMPRIQEYREKSADLTDTYYREFREAEASAAQRRRTPTRKVRKFRIDWGDFDEQVTKASLAITGPANVKSKRKRMSPEEAARQAAVDAGGSAARHVLSGGRETHLELVRRDPEANARYARVTDGDPCAFCAMLASRGPVYASKGTATKVVRGNGTRALGEKYHNNCGCTAEAVFSNTQAWPGRGREFQQLWREATKGYSGNDALNAFRRAYERGLPGSTRKARKIA